VGQEKKCVSNRGEAKEQNNARETKWGVTGKQGSDGEGEINRL